MAAEHIAGNACVSSLPGFQAMEGEVVGQVREALCELELPYRCESAGKGSAHREQLQKVSGSTVVPFLEDPNTGTSIADSEAIVRYLFSTYGTGP